jgi:hypothetical protein
MAYRRDMCHTNAHGTQRRRHAGRAEGGVPGAATGDATGRGVPWRAAMRLPRRHDVPLTHAPRPICGANGDESPFAGIMRHKHLCSDLYAWVFAGVLMREIHFPCRSASETTANRYSWAS